MTGRRLFALSSIVPVLLAPCGPAGAASASLSGAWVLNVASSDGIPADDLAVETLVMTLADQTVTFYLADGSRRVYHLSGRRERQDLGSGAVWTTAEWNGTMLRLVVTGDHGLEVHQTFSLDRRTGQLIVITSPDQRRMPMHAVRLVYDPLIDRER